MDKAQAIDRSTHRRKRLKKAKLPVEKQTERWIESTDRPLFRINWQFTNPKLGASFLVRLVA
jgi:hypothetical protein